MMFNSFYAEPQKAYQSWISSSFRLPAVSDRVWDYARLRPSIDETRKRCW